MKLPWARFPDRLDTLESSVCSRTRVERAWAVSCPANCALFQVWVCVWGVGVWVCVRCVRAGVWVCVRVGVVCV